MTIAQQLSIRNQLFERLERMFESGHQPSDFELLRLDREAQSLVKVDAAGASLVKAGIAALKWDAKTASYWVENACALEGDAVTYINSALTFKFLNDGVSAVEYSKKALQIAVNDREFVTTTAGYLIMIGEIGEAQKVLLNHENMGIDLSDAMSEVSEFSHAMDDFNISPDRLRFEMKAAFDIMTKHHVRSQDIFLSVESDPDGESCLSVGIVFYGDLALEMRLEAELAEAFLQEPGWNPSVLSVEFRYKVKDALQLV